MENPQEDFHVQSQTGKEPFKILHIIEIPNFLLFSTACVYMNLVLKVGEKLKELEDITIDILEDLAVALTSYEGQEVDLQEDFVHTVSNITSLLVGFF